jgi:ketohexokinase
LARILVVGVLVLDQILDLSEFPLEDAKYRARARVERPGGNATNLCRVLAQEGHDVELAATVAEGPAGDRLLDMLKERGIGIRFCRRKIGSVPVSVVLRSDISGSRTIIHFRDLPEWSSRDFRRIPLEEFDWFHFEGRNPGELRSMLTRTRKHRVDQPISVEFEQPRDGLSELLSMSDVALFARSWVEGLYPGVTPEAFMQQAGQVADPAIISLTWGSAGAWLAARGLLFHERRTVPVVRDSLGAGDCFSAGLIHALISGRPPELALRAAVERVTQKLGQDGLHQA